MSWIDTKEKREQIANLYSKSKQILEDSNKEKRSLTAEENATFEQLHKDAEQLKEEIRQIQKQEEAEKSIEQRLGREDFSVEHTEANASDDVAKRAFQKILRYEPLTPEEREAHEKRALSTGGSTAGAEFVPEEFHTQFYTLLKDYSGVREAGCEIITTSHGRAFNIPTVNATARKGQLLSQGSDATDDGGNDPVTGDVTLNAYIYGSEVVRISKMLARDSEYPVEQWLVPGLVDSIGRATNEHFTTGDNSGKPQGVVNGSSLGKTAAGEAAVTYNEILDLIHSLDRAYRVGAKFMMNDTTLLYLRKLVDGSGNPLWNHGNVAAAHPDTLAGYPYVINNDMADLGTSAKPILFGNFQRGYVIRDVVGMSIEVFQELYQKSLQIGYMGWIETDGKVRDATAIRHMIMDAGT